MHKSENEVLKRAKYLTAERVLNYDLTTTLRLFVTTARQPIANGIQFSDDD